MLSSDNNNRPSYSVEAAQKILKIAIERREEQGELTRQQLLEIAQDLGVEEKDLLAAEEQWLTQQVDGEEKQIFNTYRQAQFKQNLERYLIVNAFLIVLNLITSQTLSWCLVILIIWGLGLTLNAWQIFRKDGIEYEKAFQRWKLKKQVSRSIGSLADRVFKSLNS